MTEYATYTGTDIPPDGSYRTTANGTLETITSWATGYVVGVVPIVETRGHISAEGIVSLTNGLIHLGVWTNPATGTVYYDRIRQVGSYAGAMKLARRNGEIAIWDIANGVAITVRYGEGN